MRETYRCFYTSPPVWVGAPPPFLESPPFREMREPMEQFVITEKRDDIIIRFSKDGQIELRRESLDAKRPNVRDGRGVFDAFVEHINEYLQLLNALYLSLD